jgi:hypothetical protein
MKSPQHYDRALTTDEARNLSHGSTVPCDDASGANPDGSGRPCQWCAAFHAGYVMGQDEERERCKELVDQMAWDIEAGDEP